MEGQLEGQAQVDEDRDLTGDVQYESGARKRTATAKGREYRRNMIKEELKRKKSKLSKVKGEVIMEKSSGDVVTLKQKLAVTQILVWQDITELHEELKELTLEQEDLDVLKEQRQNALQEWCIFENSVKHGANQSKASGYHCNHTPNSIRSMKMELRKREAALKVQLLFIQRKKQLEREELEQKRTMEEFEIQKSLAENRAQQEVIESEESDNESQQLSNVPSANKKDDVNKFLNSLPDAEQEQRPQTKLCPTPVQSNKKADLRGCENQYPVSTLQY
ncbi:regulator of nonsense transcripts 3B-like [Ptychodera flava]|uniref:regulator of nonsense transcripts 3B-like n=1 Tax=Ptychodera flava TaxID=63121 RepID=UPI003969F624